MRVRHLRGLGARRLLLRAVTVPVGLAIAAIPAVVLPARVPLAQASPPSTAVAHIAPTPWTAQASLGAMFGGTAALSCASTADCYAVSPTVGSAEFLASSNGGATWAAKSLPAGVAGSRSISCPAAGTCFLIGSAGALPLDGATGAASVVYETRDGGTSWESHAGPKGLSLGAIDCRSVTWCVATGYSETLGHEESIVTSNGGLIWTTAIIAGVDGPDVVCPSSSECLAVTVDGDTAAITTDGARAWKALKLPELIATGVACMSATRCVIVGGSRSAGKPLALVTTDSGGSWKSEPLPGGLSDLYGAVTCPSASVCVALATRSTVLDGVSALLTTDGGTSWRSVDLTVAAGVPFAGSSSIACPSASVCVTSGVLSPPGLFMTGPGVAVPAPERIVYSSTGGATWRTATLPAGGLAVALGCWSSTQCAAPALTNGGPATEVTTNGKTWGTMPAAVAAGILQMTCTGPATCVGLGGADTSTPTFVRTTDGGNSWSRLFTFTFSGSKFSTGDSLACTSPSVCYAAFSVLSSSLETEAVVEHTSDGGTSWTTLSLPNPISSAGQAYVSCTSTTDCVISDGDTLTDYTVNSGVTWTTAKLPKGYREVGAVSCGSPTTCVMAAGTAPGDSDYAVSTLWSSDSGAVWSLGGALGNGLMPRAIDCASATSCELLGQSTASAPMSYSTTNNGDSWSEQSPPVRLGATGQWDSLYCPASGRCEASGTGPAGEGFLFGLG